MFRFFSDVIKLGPKMTEAVTSFGKCQAAISLNYR